MLLRRVFVRILRYENSCVVRPVLRFAVVIVFICILHVNSNTAHIIVRIIVLYCDFNFIHYVFVTYFILGILLYPEFQVCTDSRQLNVKIDKYTNEFESNDLFRCTVTTTLQSTKINFSYL